MRGGKRRKKAKENATKKAEEDRSAKAVMDRETNWTKSVAVYCQ